MVDLLYSQRVQSQDHLLKQITLLQQSQVSRDKLLEISAGDLHLDHDNIELCSIKTALILSKVKCQLLDHMLLLT